MLDLDRVPELFEILFPSIFGHDRIGSVDLVLENNENSNPVVTVMGLVVKVINFVLKFSCRNRVDLDFLEGCLFTERPG